MIGYAEPRFLEQLEAMPYEHPLFLLIFAAGVGLCVGSFCNVVIYRLPRYCLSIVKPRSFCPKCKTPLAWYDNLPVLSWVFLLARCRKCKVKISWQYPAVELLIGAVFVLFAWRILIEPTGVVTTQHLLLAIYWSCASATLLVASWIDAQMKIIPDSISLGGSALALFLAPLVPIVHTWGVPQDLISAPLFGSTSWEPWQRAWFTTFLIMLIAAASLWLIGFLGQFVAPKQAAEHGGAMGLGDVKLIMLMAALLGWPKLLLAFFVAVFAGAVLGMPMLFRKYVLKRETDSAIAFGPFLALGTFVMMIVPDWIFAAVRWYIDLGR